jgi:hypothetical protein
MPSAIMKPAKSYAGSFEKARRSSLEVQLEHAAVVLIEQQPADADQHLSLQAAFLALTCAFTAANIRHR